MDIKNSGEDLYLTKKVGGETLWKFVCIADYVDFEACQCEAKCPADVAKHHPGIAENYKGVVIMMLGKPETLLCASARLGFRGLHVQHLQKLLAKLGRPAGARPTTEKPLVEACVRIVFPFATGDFVKECWLARGKRATCESLLTTDGNLEKLEHSLDGDDHVELKQTVVRAKRVKAEAQVAAAAPEVESSEVLALPIADLAAVAKKSSDRRPFPFLDEWDVGEARTYLPCVAKCYLAKDVKRFLRWSGNYPKPPPFCVTKSWGPHTGLSQHEALVWVLRRLWGWHTEATGEACTIDWGAF